ncbi:MAG: hypothetical protein J6Y53_02375 [Alphaproteobacteria bacterium]|nr:hypothetical protein [Alphaproteobacteria bacterium]
MKKELIDKLVEELKENFEELDLQSPRNLRREDDDLSMLILLPDHWQKVKWAVDVCRRYDLENTTDTALFLTEAGFRCLAKRILSEGKYPAKGENVQHPSIH